MRLEEKSKELKNLVSEYNEDWFLGDLWFTIHSGRERSMDQLSTLSSPLRQLYYLAGLTMSTSDDKGFEIIYDEEKWKKIVVLLNEIEVEYYKLFFPQNSQEKIDNDWILKRQVAMPSFLSYFNQGHLNYEEQLINWISELFTPLDNIIQQNIGITTNDLLEFYEIVDSLIQKNFQAHSTNPALLRDDWKKYTKIQMGVNENVPDFIKEYAKEFEPRSYFMTDKGIILRFTIKEICSENLTEEKLNKILDLLSFKRKESDFLYYTETKPGNPLFEKPIINIGSGQFQVFEPKQILHAIDNLLENTCKTTDKYLKKKGSLLESKIVKLFNKYFKGDETIFTSYFINNCEQDILILWKEYAFIIESKAFQLKEPFRDPEKAFIRIKNEFNASIGYGYLQTKRVEDIFNNKEILEIKDNKGNVLEKIDTSKYTTFSIIVNQNSFGQVQHDLSLLLEIDDDDVFPWAVKYDDLEIFLLTLIAQNKNPKMLVDFLMMRENLHGKLICSDELEVCGAFITKKLNPKSINYAEVITTTPEMGDLFDKQYHKGIGFDNEKYLYEKQSGKFMIW